MNLLSGSRHLPRFSFAIFNLQGPRDEKHVHVGKMNTLTMKLSCGITLHNTADALTHMYTMCMYSSSWVLMLKKPNQQHPRDDLSWSLLLQMRL